MSDQRKLRLGAFMRPTTIHTGGWRYPGAYADANFNFERIKNFAQRLEGACFDGFFMADHLAVLNMPVEALRRSTTPTSFEPFTLLSALSIATNHLGLMATGSTTYDEPYHIARRFASLDHISGGRAGETSTACRRGIAEQWCFVIRDDHRDSARRRHAGAIRGAISDDVAT